MDLRAVPPRNDLYWHQIRVLAARLDSDGCTGVADFYLDACLEHDVHWRTGKTIYGDRISTRESNARFRRVIQDRSPFGRLSPMSWWRWAAVSVVGVWRNGRPVEV